MALFEGEKGWGLIKLMVYSSVKQAKQNQDKQRSIGVIATTYCTHKRNRYRFQFKRKNYTDTFRARNKALSSRERRFFRADECVLNSVVGRIDLLTATEIISIKDISQCSGALGQILAYSAFFPNHSKRIHLFGFQDLSKLVSAQSTCSEFGIVVTFEECSND